MGNVARAFRNVWRRKTRASLVIIALGFSVAILISIPAATRAQTSLVESLVETQSTSFRGIIELAATEIVVAPPLTSGSRGGGFGGFRGPPTQAFLNESIVDEIVSISEVTAVLPQLQSFVTLETGEEPGEHQPFSRNFMTLIGIPLDSTIDDEYGIQPSNIVEGRQLQEGDSRAAIVGLNLTETFALGDDMTIGEYSFQVVGVFDSGNVLTNRYAYAALPEVQSLLDVTDQVSLIRVFATDVSEVNDVVDIILAAFGDSVSVTTQEQLLESISEQFQQIEELVGQQFVQVEDIANQEILISAMVGGMIVLSTMFYTVRERTKEIGIMKALGFTKWNVMTQFMIEGLIIGAAGGLVGVLIAGIGASTLANILLPSISFLNPGGFGVQFGQRASRFGSVALPSIAPDINLVLLGLGVAILLGGIGSLYPSWWASRKRPAEALRHE